MAFLWNRDSTPRLHQAYRRRVSRPARSLVYLLIAAQLLLAVPAAAFSVAAATPSTADCAGMPMDHDDDHCPCCPDGVTTTLDCLASCTMAAAVLPSVPVIAQAVLPAAPVSRSLAELAAFESPPLKPPPIR